MQEEKAKEGRSELSLPGSLKITLISHVCLFFLCGHRPHLSPPFGAWEALQQLRRCGVNNDLRWATRNDHSSRLDVLVGPSGLRVSALKSQSCWLFFSLSLVRHAWLGRPIAHAFIISITIAFTSWCDQTRPICHMPLPPRNCAASEKKKELRAGWQVGSVPSNLACFRSWMKSHNRGIKSRRGDIRSPPLHPPRL